VIAAGSCRWASRGTVETANLGSSFTSLLLHQTVTTLGMAVHDVRLGASSFVVKPASLERACDHRVACHYIARDAKVPESYAASACASKTTCSWTDVAASSLSPPAPIGSRSHGICLASAA